MGGEARKGAWSSAPLSWDALDGVKPVVPLPLTWQQQDHHYIPGISRDNTGVTGVLNSVNVLRRNGDERAPQIDRLRKKHFIHHTGRQATLSTVFTISYITLGGRLHLAQSLPFHTSHWEAGYT